MKQLAFQIDGSGGTIYKLTNPLPTDTNLTGAGSLANIVSIFLNITLLAAGFLLLIWLIIAAFEWMTSQGDKEKLTKARARMTYAIIGFVIIVLAFTLKDYIYAVLQPITPPITNVSIPL